MSSESRAVSPVIAVILMVAVTVILSAAVGAFVFELGETTSDTQSQSLGVRTTADGSKLTVHVITGEADELQLLINGTTDSILKNPSSGDTLSTTNATTHSKIAIVARTDGQSSIVSTQNPLSSSGPIPPTEGLITHWKLDGDAQDSVGSKHGTVSGAKFIDAHIGQGAYFNGSNGNTIDVPSFSTFSAYTVSYWINPDSIADSNSRHVLTLRENNQLQTRQDGTGDILFQHNDTSTWYNLRTSVSNTGWTQITATWNGTVLTLYKNGSQVDNASISTMASGGKTSLTQIGSSDGTNYVWNGSIDSVRIYERGLTEQEVKDLYNATK